MEGIEVKRVYPRYDLSNEIAWAFLLSRVEEQVKLLSNELEWMRLFLKDADAKRRYDPRIKLWVSQIRDVTYDAEDVIDRFMFEMNNQ